MSDTLTKLIFTLFFVHFIYYKRSLLDIVKFIYCSEFTDEYAFLGIDKYIYLTLLTIGSHVPLLAS